VEAEGVIKFELYYEETGPLALDELIELNQWRSRIWKLRLIGQDPGRYEGYGYGNVSQRSGASDAARGERTFVISGTQTGALPELDNRHYTKVEHYDPGANRVEAKGPIRPSSESLTHGIVYDQDPAIRAVLHVHSPDIWQAAGRLGIPVTNDAVAYGTPAMAAEVLRLFRDTHIRQQRIFAMGGHKDGIVAFGESVAEAGDALMTTLALIQSQQQQQATVTARDLRGQ